MKNAGRWGVFMGLALAACGPAEAPPAAPSSAAPSQAASLEVVARLVEVPKNLALCGDAHFAAVMRYEVVSVQRGSYQGPKLLVIYDCPLNGWTGIKEFRPGDVHQLQLATGKPPAAVIDDPYGEPSLPRFLVVKATPAPQR